MEREREREREREGGERDTKPTIANGGGSHPGSTTTTPYGSYDQAGYWPQYPGAHYPVGLPGGPPPPHMMGGAQHAAGDDKHRSSKRGHGSSHAHTSHAHYDEAQARHSHSHDPSHPQHHSSLNRPSARHAYAPYGYPGSTDHSQANSPTSSRGSSEHSDDDDQQHHGQRPHHPNSKSRSSHPHYPPPVHGHGPSGIGRGSQPGHAQQQQIGQLHQALAFNLGKASDASPVLGPLEGLTLMSAAGSRAGSRAPSRASSPIHLPPLKLSSGETSGTGSPENSAPVHDAHHGHADAHSSSHLRQERQRAHPYGQKSQPGSPVYDRPTLSRTPSQHVNSSHSSIHPAPPSPLESNPTPPTSALSTSADRTLPGISSFGQLYSNGGASNPGSRHNSPPGSPHFQAAVGSHFSSATASTDSLASMANGAFNRPRAGFAMTPMSTGAPSSGGAYFPHQGDSRSASEDAKSRAEDDEGEDQLMDV